MREHIIDIVERYVDTKIRKSGDENVICRCPFHKGGQEKKPSFSVNVEKGLFNCFTCHESGTIPTLLRQLGLSPQEVEKEVGGIQQSIRDNIARLKERKRAQYFTDNPYRASCMLSEAILGAWEWCPTQLVAQGFNPQWLQYLQVGVDLQNQRITYPIRDIYGNLAGVVGGWTRAGQMPKYKVYQGKRKGLDGYVIPGDYGPWFDEEYPEYNFRNHDYLWNYDRVYPRVLLGDESAQLIIVEGFKACLWLLQHGWRNVVALMGSKISGRQLELISRVQAEVLLFLDNDEAGQAGTYHAGAELQRTMPTVRAVNYPPLYEEGSQPDDLDYFTLTSVLNSAPLFRQWKRERNHKWV